MTAERGRRLLMVLGANSAGKSNLFDAFALLSRLAQMDVSQALKAGRGSIRDQFSRTSGGVADTMSFAVELLLSDLRFGLTQRGQYMRETLAAWH